MEDKKKLSYESLFDINVQQSTEKFLPDDPNIDTLKKIINNRRYNRGLFKKLLVALENNKEYNKDIKFIDKIKYGIKPGKNWEMYEQLSEDKKMFQERFSCTYMYRYSNDIDTGKEVINELIENRKKEISKKCKAFEPEVKQEYPSARSKLDFSVDKKVEGSETEVLFIINFIIFIPVETFKGVKSTESFDENLEQKDIISRDIKLFSIEEDDGGSFEEAASEGDDNGWGDGGDDDGTFEEPSMDDGGDDNGWGDDSGGDDGWGDDGSGDGDGDSEGGGNKVDVFDSNKGSSMNPFTQINQKLYQLETLNELRLSIKKAIELYSAQYADWSEVCQLKELSEILDEERKSFMMQQNPENLMKLGLYYDQYDRLVQNISNRISKINVNNRH